MTTRNELVDKLTKRLFDHSTEGFGSDEEVEELVEETAIDLRVFDPNAENMTRQMDRLDEWQSMVMAEVYTRTASKLLQAGMEITDRYKGGGR